MTTLVAIAGLAFLILVHEAGHFVTALAVGMRPRKFYLGFPPPLLRTTRGGVEYGIGLIPLGGYVKIPGMFRPAVGDLGRWFGRAQDEDATLHRPLERLAGALERSDFDAARADLDALDAALAEAPDLSEAARRQTERGVVELRDALAPDAYWRQRSWRRIVVIFAGPGTNLLLAIVLGLVIAFGPVTADGIWPGLAFLALLQVTAVCFNLIPLPPFDGYGAIRPHLAPDLREKMDAFGQVSLLLVLAVFWFIPTVSNVFWGLVTFIVGSMGIPSELVGLGYQLFRFWAPG